MDKQYVNSNIAYQYSLCKCEDPQIVMSSTGKRVVVGCGKCCSCLQKRRFSWAKRLNDEFYKNPLCLGAFGFTLTYKPEHVPFLDRKTLEKKKYKYSAVNSSHSYLVVKRGCDPETLKKGGENVGLAYSRDLDLYIKKVRKQIEKEFPTLFIRYFISSDYGEIEDGRCGMPHYHGAIFICGKTPLIAQTLKHTPLYLQLEKRIKQIVLDKWTFSERKFDPIKRIYYGKDTHEFGEKWSDYLGKYLNKETESNFSVGSKYIPVRSFCSRKSKKYDCLSLGVGTLDDLTVKRWQNELIDCFKNNKLFNPTYNENGITKSLPSAYKKEFIQYFFGVKLSRVNLFIKWCNYIKENPPRKGERYFYFPKKYRSQSSIITPPTGLNEIKTCPYFSPVEVYRILRFLVFRKWQSELYLKKYHLDDPTTYDIKNNFKGGKNVGLFSLNRAKMLSTCETIKKKALQKKHYHEIKNGYKL